MNGTILSYQSCVERVKLNRGGKHNALNERLLTKLIDVFETLQKEDNKKLIVIEGEGSSFCVGLDFGWVADEINNASGRFAKLMSRLLALMSAYSAPIISVAKGWTCGGGIGILACSDIVIADKQAEFCLPEIKSGLVPAIISPYLFKHFSAKQMAPFYLTGDVMSVERACELGLVHFVSDTKDGPNVLEGVLHKLMSYDQEALKICKLLLNKEVYDDPLVEKNMINFLIKRAGSTAVKASIEKFLNRKNK